MAISAHKRLDLGLLNNKYITKKHPNKPIIRPIYQDVVPIILKNKTFPTSRKPSGWLYCPDPRYKYYHSCRPPYRPKLQSVTLLKIHLYNPCYSP